MSKSTLSPPTTQNKTKMTICQMNQEPEGERIYREMFNQLRLKQGIRQDLEPINYQQDELFAQHVICELDPKAQEFLPPYREPDRGVYSQFHSPQYGEFSTTKFDQQYQPWLELDPREAPSWYELHDGSWTRFNFHTPNQHDTFVPAQFDQQHEPMQEFHFQESYPCHEASHTRPWPQLQNWPQQIQLNPEQYDRKNLHLDDDEFFLGPDHVNIPSPLIVKPWKETIKNVTRRRSIIALTKWTQTHAPASDWKFCRRFPYAPRKDKNWRELEHQMTGLAVEEMSRKWVDRQSHWVRASASDEALRIGRWGLHRGSLSL